MAGYTKLRVDGSIFVDNALRYKLFHTMAQLNVHPIAKEVFEVNLYIFSDLRGILLTCFFLSSVLN